MRANHNRISVRHWVFRLLMLTMVASLSTGCVYNQSVKLARGAQPQVLITPAKSQPVLIVSEHASSMIFGGVTGLLIERAATTEVRKSLEDRLNEDMKTFAPELVLAEECAKLLQNSTGVRFADVVVRPEAVDVPGRDELFQREPKAFKTSTKDLFEWHKVYARWIKTAPAQGGTAPPQAAGPAIALEVTFPRMLINHGNRLEAHAGIRVLDLSSGKIIGKQYSIVTYKLTPVTKTSDLKVFHAEFRKHANDLARRSLKELKLL